MRREDLLGKRIKEICDSIDGIIILFDDNSAVEISQSNYPDGSHGDTYFEELTKEEYENKIFGNCPTR